MDAPVAMRCIVSWNTGEFHLAEACLQVIETKDREMEVLTMADEIRMRHVHANRLVYPAVLRELSS